LLGQRKLSQCCLLLLLQDLRLQMKLLTQSKHLLLQSLNIGAFSDLGTCSA